MPNLKKAVFIFICLLLYINYSSTDEVEIIDNNKVFTFTGKVTNIDEEENGYELTLVLRNDKLIKIDLDNKYKSFKIDDKILVNCLSKKKELYKGCYVVKY